MSNSESKTRYRGELAANWRASVEASNYYLGLLDALSLVGLPGMILSSKGKKLAANEIFQSLWASARNPAANFTFCNALGDRKLKATLQTIDSGNKAEWPVKIGIQKQLRTEAIAVYVWVVNCPGHEERVALLSAHKFGHSRGAAEELLRSLFRLTPAEAKVARAIAAGESVSSIAKKFKVSRETIRTHLASVLSKTGTNRQTELALRVANLGLPSEP